MEKKDENTNKNIKRNIAIILSTLAAIIIVCTIFFTVNLNKSKDNKGLELNYINNEKSELENKKEEINCQIKELENQIYNGANGDTESLNKKIEDLQNQKNNIEKEIANQKADKVQQEQSNQNIQQEQPNQNTQQEQPNQNIQQEQPNQNTQQEQPNQNTQQEQSNQNIQQEQPNQNTITVSKTNIIVEENLTSERIKITFSRGIENIIDYHIVFSNSNDAIANVGWDGSFDGTIYIYGYKPGTTTITITDLDDPGPSATINVTVKPKTKVTGIVLDKTTVNGYVGKTYFVNATINPSNAQEKFINWYSSNPNVASVTWGGGDPSQGIINALKEGTTIITAKSLDGGFQATCIVTVSTIAVEGIEITTRPKLNYYKGETLQLKYKITPNDATNQRVTWSSDNNSIATVDSNGLVTFHDGIAYKNVHITVTTEDGKYSDMISLYCVPDKTN